MINVFKSKIALNIKGKNINRFIKKLTSRKIDILSLKYINSNEINIIVYKRDYEKILKIKTIYDILETDVFGYLKIKKILKLNYHLILIFIIVCMVFLVLINTIFSVEVIHSNKQLRKLIINELEFYNIKKYSLKKDYDEIEKIKKNILKKFPDKIEWLEIENIGSKYVVRVEEREIQPIKNETKARSIVASKNAVLKKIVAQSGEIVKSVDDYVKKGEVIVNGSLYVDDKEKGKVRVTGNVYGEVWYVLKINYPFAYFEKQETGRQKENYVIKILNKEIDLSVKHYKHKKALEKEIVSHSLLPFSIVYQKQKELRVINQVLTFEQALNLAQNTLENKVKNKLKSDEYIIKSKYLKSRVKETNVEVEMFFAVYENITDYQDINDIS